MVKKIKTMVSEVIRFCRLIRFRIFVFTNDRHKTDIALHKKLLLNIRGFESDKWIFYDLKDNNINEYMSDYQRWKGRLVNGAYNLILDDKILSSEIFRNHVNWPRTLGWLR